MCREHCGSRISSPTFLKLRTHHAFGNQKLKFASRRNLEILRPLKNSKLFTFQRLENQKRKIRALARNGKHDFVGKVLLLIFYYRYRESIITLNEL